MSNLIYNSWYVAGWADEFDRTPRQRMLLGKPVVLYRREDGTLVALEDRCIHRMAPLSMGQVEGDDIRCLYHGFRFAPDGQCNDIPGQDMIPRRACVRSYPVYEKSSWAWVWMGDKEPTDTALIADAKALDDPEWILRRGELDYEANYQLINDNLLDLTHLTYVHSNSFGADEAWSVNRPVVETLPNGVRNSRWIVNTPPVPPLGKAAGLDRVDIWTSYDFIIPGVFLLYTAIYQKGTAQDCDFSKPGEDREVLFNNFTSQAVVPTGESTTRYYFSWGPGSAFGDDAIADLMIDTARQAFFEDKVMIEAQQRIIACEPERPPMPSNADKAITLFQRMMKSLDKTDALQQA
ncbi:aromatic ring-hydroxylating dioxygenase subunit alpha [Altericroceibacterium spongiae]|uniref:Aromatic ring-hydroxylating dioxygenase subunit alpha n=1 Tax=Altericroceibacterium spongiae TaxID=2320269 RepID=A0A420E7M6_9SPHN|nr:aromatic ring-hydroxylating dioxygenase subunit alpha [Altericroceibacterium spongiae]RKF15476.1 aromatic ring-hydroxylating dioxygenase subunit alpha [Altericroceibacterium spongiae]